MSRKVAAPVMLGFEYQIAQSLEPPIRDASRSAEYPTTDNPNDHVTHFLGARTTSSGKYATPKGTGVHRACASGSSANPAVISLYIRTDAAGPARENQYTDTHSSTR